MERGKMGSNGRFSDGLLLGAILGGTAVFLLGTKKGNKVLKVLTNEGIDGLSSIISDFEDGVSEGIKKTAKRIENATGEEVRDLGERMIDDQEVLNSRKPSKRFFKKSK